MYTYNMCICICTGLKALYYLLQLNKKVSVRAISATVPLMMDRSMDPIVYTRHEQRPQTVSAATLSSLHKLGLVRARMHMLTHPTHF